MRFKFKRFLDIDDDYMLSDMHIHSTWTDGMHSVREIIRSASDMGLKRICITDHIRRESSYYKDAYWEVKRLGEELNFEILSGFEAKVEDFSGRIDVSPEDLSLADISIASVHRFPIGRRLLDVGEFNEETGQIIELELSIAAIKKGGFSILGHPGGMSIRKYGNFKTEYFEEIIKEVSCTKIAFDFNASYHFVCKEELNELFKTYNPYIAIGSDAHSVKDIGNGKLMF